MNLNGNPLYIYLCVLLLSSKTLFRLSFIIAEGCYYICCLIEVLFSHIQVDVATDATFRDQVVLCKTLSFKKD